MALDLDSQNALVRHFDVPTHAAGIARSTIQGGGWETLPRAIVSHQPRHNRRFSLQLLPFGRVSDLDIEAFECLVSLDSQWLTRHLQKLGLPHASLVIVDLPAGFSSVVQHVLQTAHVTMSVSQVDDSSYADLAHDEKLVREYCLPRRDYVRHCYLFNHVDQAHNLDKGLIKLLRAQYQGNIAAFVHQNESIEDALALHTTVFDYQAESQAVRDYNQAAEFIARALSNHYGHIMPPRFA